MWLEGVSSQQTTRTRDAPADPGGEAIERRSSLGDIRAAFSVGVGRLVALGSGRVRLVLESHFSHGAPPE